MIQSFFSNLQNRDTALTLASDKGHESIVRDLLKSGADPNVQTKVSYVCEDVQLLIILNIQFICMVVLGICDI